MPTIGTTPLPAAITAGVTTGHVAHSISAWREYNADIFANTVNVMSAEYGAVDGGSAATNTAALNTARADIVATGKPGAIYIPAGVNLPVTPGGVIGGSNIRYFGGGKLSTTQTSAGYLITFPAGSTNFEVDGLVFESPNDHITAIYVKSASSSMSSDFTIQNNRCINAELVVTNDDAHIWSAVSTHATTGNVTRNARILNNRGKRTGTNLSDKAFILMHYTIGAAVVGNVIDGYPFGIQWWGGDANPAADGAVANERRCGEIVIAANRVQNILAPSGGAGIWGSMGYDVTVTGNNVKECNDVGIDFEGCFDSSAVANIVTNCTNGCLTSFSYSLDVLFEANICKSDSESLARVQNGSGNAIPRVRFIGNDFRCTNGVGGVLLETSAFVEFSKNQCRNVWLFTRINNQKHTVADDNTLIFDTAEAAAFNALDFGANNAGGRLKARGNTIISTVAQPAGSRGIYNAQIDAGSPPTSEISANEIVGFPIAIENSWSGTGSNAAVAWYRDNIIPVGTSIVVTETGSITSVVLRERNKFADMTAVP